MNELNKKLLELAGFKYHSYEVHEYEHKDTLIDDPYWEDPKGQECEILPDFPNNLNACFEHLINPREDILRVEFSYRTRYPEPEVKCRITMRSWHPDRTKGRVAFNGVAPKDKPALALSKAIEQLIKEMP